MKTAFLFLAVLPLGPLAALNAAESSLEKTDLFIAGQADYKLYRIPGIVVTKRGTVLAYCEARKSDSGDWGPIDVLMRRSTDGGRTWLHRQQVVHLEGDLPINPVAAAQNLDKPGDNTVNNPVAIVDHETGAVHFLYCLEYMRCFYMRSDDDGVIWTEPVEITKTFEAFHPQYDWKVLATGPAHGIQLAFGEHKGRMVVPVWLSLGTGGHAHRPSVTATIFSDDHGKTWQRGEIAVPDTPEFIFPSETVVVQLADGRVMLNSRSESKRHRRLLTVGPDGATGWSKPRFDGALLEPICMAGIVRVRDAKYGRSGLIAFSNPHNLSRRDGKEAAGRSRDRVNVSIKLSYDEGQTWPCNRTLEEDFSGYSDLAALGDGTILCFYERGSTDEKSSYRTGRLTVARFNEQWVRAGETAGSVSERMSSKSLLPSGERVRMRGRVADIGSSGPPSPRPSPARGRGSNLKTPSEPPRQKSGQAKQPGDLPQIVPANKLPGIVLDNEAAEFTGSWVNSSIQPPLVGATYQHDNNTDRGRKTAVFTPEITAAGEYEVRLLYTCHENRATNASVTIHSADGEKTVTVNQRQPVLVDRVPRALGVFRFEAGTKGHVVVSNKNADGYVVVDGVQFVPIKIAREERAGRRDSGFADIKRPVDPARESTRRNERAAAVAVSPLAPKMAPAKAAERSDEPVRLAASASPTAIDGKSYDVVIVGGTGGGVACAVRAAREGCTVLLVQHNGHIGGMMTNGLMQWDALYGGPRSPLFTELLGNIEDYYIATFGRDSPVHQIIRYTHEHYPIGWAEPHVAEREYNRLVAAEENITLLLDHYPTAVERDGALIKSVTLRRRGTSLPPVSRARRRSPDLAESADRRSPELANRSTIQGDLRSGISAGSETLAQRESYGDILVRGTTFVDATYEGDLFALAKVPYRVGREARNEYDEPHAGKVFVNIAHGPPQSVAREGLNIRSYGGRLGSVDPDSPFTADGAVQAYNYRFCVTSDPANRLPIPKPASYRREEYADYGRKYIGARADRCPNRKSHVNSPILPGENHDYPEADWPMREKIIQRHLDFGLGLMWFLQNDESVPLKQREKFRIWGLPKDEFADNGHVPPEMYVREARRIVGRHVFTEHDGMLAKDFARTPVHPDSIAVTDWYMDSHACTTDSRPGFKYDGKLILTEESRPSQIPYRSLLPQGVDNLLVPVCLSATHIAWGAIRLEPVYMQTGEAAGFAAALAKQQKTSPAALDSDLLVRTLIERRQLVSFFNDLKVTDLDPSIPAAQYFGTKGFFNDYNARLDQPLTESVAKLWADGLAQLNADTLDPNELAAQVQKAEAEDSPDTDRTRGEVLQKMWKRCNKPGVSDE